MSLQDPKILFAVIKTRDAKAAAKAVEVADATKRYMPFGLYVSLDKNADFKSHAWTDTERDIESASTRKVAVSSNTLSRKT